MAENIFKTGKWIEFIVDKINPQLRQVFKMYAETLPKPTKENTDGRNTHILIDLRDEFLKHEEGSTRYKEFEGLFNLVITRYDHDRYYGDRIDWLLKQWLKTDWVFWKHKVPGRAWKK